MSSVDIDERETVNKNKCWVEPKKTRIPKTKTQSASNTARSVLKGSDADPDANDITLVIKGNLPSNISAEEDDGAISLLQLN